MWRLFCHYLFLISPTFGASARLCLVNVAFSLYLHLYLLLCTVCVSLPEQGLLLNEKIGLYEKKYIFLLCYLPLNLDVSVVL